MPSDFFFLDLKYDSVTLSQYQDNSWQRYESVTAHWSGRRLDSLQAQFTFGNRRDVCHFTYRRDSTLDRAVTWSSRSGSWDVVQIDSFFYDAGGRMTTVGSSSYGAVPGKTRTQFSYNGQHLARALTLWLSDTGWRVRSDAYYYFTDALLKEVHDGSIVRRYFYDSTLALQTILITQLVGNDEAPIAMSEFHGSRLVPRLLLQTSTDTLVAAMGDTLETKIRVTNISGAAVRLIAEVTDDSILRVQTPSDPIALARDSAFELAVRFTPVRRGVRESTVYVQDNEGQTYELNIFAVSLESHLSHFPDTARFADIPPGEESTSTIVLVNDGDGDIQIDSLWISSEKFTEYNFEPKHLSVSGALGVTVHYMSDFPSYDTALLVLNIQGICGPRKDTCMLIASAGKGQRVDSAYSKTELSLMPTPCAEQIVVRSPRRVETYWIFDSDGRLVQQGAPREADFVVQVHSLPPGGYLLDLRTSMGSQSARFIRKR